MAVLSDNDRINVWTEWMRQNLANVSISKPDLRAAVNALDQYLSDNANAINQTIPQPARGALSQEQKARLLMLVIARRYLAGV